ncbi:hypothetical protein [Chamaesiphon sp. OTE_75_metabat_556]|uniref:hypothetical protein n=1 Tax=Chamaesiphon sp. OTE_75_metabat_556 TaxID=2964692 RepID=UPI00286D631C|nr:hypothetical protein [Chamaesiphon sp. OTE_75_metabat_556]
MNTATANLIVLTAALADGKIAGTAIDGDVRVPFAADATEVNQQIFVPEANLVVTGKFWLRQGEISSVGLCIESVLAVVALPATAPVDVVAPAVPSEDAAPVDVVAPVLSHSRRGVSSGIEGAAAATKKRKSSTTRSKKKAATELVAA